MIDKSRIFLISIGLLFILIGSIVTNDNGIKFILQGIYILGIILLTFGFINIKKYQNEKFLNPESINSKYIKSFILITIFVFILVTVFFKITELFILLFFLVAIFFFLATKVYSNEIKDSNELEIYINSKSIILGLQIFLVVIFITSLSFAFYLTWSSQTDIGSAFLALIYIVTSLLLIIEFVKIILTKTYQ